MLSDKNKELLLKLIEHYYDTNIYQIMEENKDIEELVKTLKLIS